jgi:hypothetical protein
MLKIVLSVLFVAVVANAGGCPFGFTDIHNGWPTHYYYRYLGTTNTQADAVQQCLNATSLLGSPLVMPKNEISLNDLFSLYKGYSNSIFIYFF